MIDRKANDELFKRTKEFASEWGETLEEMDLESFLNIRDWLQEAIESKGAKVTDAGIGGGYADIGFELNGAPFAVKIKPRPM